MCQYCPDCTDYYEPNRKRAVLALLPPSGEARIYQRPNEYELGFFAEEFFSFGLMECYILFVQCSSYLLTLIALHSSPVEGAGPLCYSIYSEKVEAPRQ